MESKEDIEQIMKVLKPQYQLYINSKNAD